MISSSGGRSDAGAAASAGRGWGRRDMDYKMTYKKTKDQSIETLRGIAIILVVAGFIINTDMITQASRSIVSSCLYFSYYLLIPVRMPLFTVISAYLYASFPATQDTFRKLVIGKSRRLLFTYFFVSTIQYVSFSVFHVQGARPLAEILNIYLRPFQQFWFLWAIFWIFVIIGYLDSIKALETKGKWLGWLALSAVSHIAFEPSSFMGLKGINYILPFFLMGYGIRRFSKELFTFRMIILYAVMVILAYGAYFYFRKLPHVGQFHKTLALMCSFSIVPLVFHFRRNIPLLSRIGYFAFGIFIFNRISVALTRMLLERLHINNEVFLFGIYLSSGILLSIGIQIILEQFPATNKYILGVFPKETRSG